MWLFSKLLFQIPSSGLCLDCYLVLRKALLAFDPMAPVKAALQLKEFKVLRRLLFAQLYSFIFLQQQSCLEGFFLQSGWLPLSYSFPLLFLDEKSDMLEHAVLCFDFGG